MNAQGLQIGDGNTQHNHFHGRQVQWPLRVGVVPMPADRRLDRPADEALAQSRGTTVVAGLGGVGKTQLAASLADRLWAEGRVDLLIWVSATSRSAVLTGYGQAACDVTGVEDSDLEQGAARLLAWLAGTGKRWLVVLDDLTEPADLRRLWPPTSATGRTVVTTRRRDAALVQGRRLIDVDLFTAKEAAAYLAGKLDGESDQADLLAADLGYLPLALAQAATYILDQGLTCAGYRERLARRRLAALSPQLLPDDQATPVAQTWALSADLADAATDGLGLILLQIAAVLDPNGIPLDLFATRAVTGYCEERLGRPVDAEETRDAIRTLHRLSLASITASVRVHALVQRATWEATGDEHQRPLAITAADALLEVWPDTERSADHAQHLRANAAVLHQSTGALLWGLDDGAHSVLFLAGSSLGNTGLLGAAVTYFQQLHTVADQQLGPDHPDTLTIRNNLAFWRGAAGDHAGAVIAMRELLADRLRLFAPDEAGTLSVRHNLARWRGETGDPAGAARDFAELLADQLRVLGPDHPDTFNTRNNLAYWRGEVGDPAEAAAAVGELHATVVRHLGPDHPETLDIRHHFAHWRGQAGDPVGAATAFEELLTDRLRVLGPDHPDTLITRHYLARLRGDTGDPAGAVAAFEHLLADYLRVLGPDHPDTVNTRRNLDYWRSAQ